MIREAIIKLSKKEDLRYDEAESVMNEIMDGAATPVQMASYLTALSMKGETIDEITASAAGMRAHCIKLLHDMDVLEIVGTGGDGSNSFNQHFHNFFSCDRGRRRSGCKTRKPCSILQERSRRCSGSSWRKDYHSARKKCRNPEKDQHLFPVRTELSHCHEICGTDPKRAGNPYSI